MEITSRVQRIVEILNAIRSGEKYKQNKARMTNRALQLRHDDNDLEVTDDCC